MSDYLWEYIKLLKQLKQKKQLKHNYDGCCEHKKHNYDGCCEHKKHNYDGCCEHKKYDYDGCCEHKKYDYDGRYEHKKYDYGRYQYTEESIGNTTNFEDCITCKSKIPNNNYYAIDDILYLLERGKNSSGTNNYAYLGKGGKDSGGANKDPKDDSIPRRPSTATLTLNLRVYFLGYNSLTDELVSQLRRDIENANEVWNKCNIRVNVINNNGRGEVLETEDEYTASDLSCQGTPGPKNAEFFDLARGITNNFSMSVFYLPGERLFDDTVGCNSISHRFVNGTLTESKSIIYIALNGRDEFTLAHEIGHGLFDREIGRSNWDNPNPSINNQAPGDVYHDSRFDNVMYAFNPPPPPNRPRRNNVDSIQCQISRNSHFLTFK